nr:hypothetical protein Iba_scaffold30243CG0010 [Ipomoea batatas]
MTRYDRAKKISMSRGGDGSLTVKELLSTANAIIDNIALTPETPDSYKGRRFEALRASLRLRSVCIMHYWGKREARPPWLQRTGVSGSPRQDTARSSQCPKAQKVGKEGEE